MHTRPEAVPLGAWASTAPVHRAIVRRARAARAARGHGRGRSRDLIGRVPKPLRHPGSTRVTRTDIRRPLWPQKHATKSPAHHPMHLRLHLRLHLRSRPSIAGCTYWRPFGAVGPLAWSSPKPRTPARWPCARGAKRELQGRSRAQPSHNRLTSPFGRPWRATRCIGTCARALESEGAYPLRAAG